MENEVAGGNKLVTIAVIAVGLLAITALTATSFNDNRAATNSIPGDVVAETNQDIDASISPVKQSGLESARKFLTSRLYVWTSRKHEENAY